MRSVSSRFPRGSLFIAIYNDQGWKSHVWWFVKRIYNRLPGFLEISVRDRRIDTIAFSGDIKHAIKLQADGCDLGLLATGASAE